MINVKIDNNNEIMRNDKCQKPNFIPLKGSLTRSEPRNSRGTLGSRLRPPFLSQQRRGRAAIV